MKRIDPEKSCVCNCKDTNLKAIHNTFSVTRGRNKVVFATAKILIWKQFTTKRNSFDLSFSCVCNCKDTNLKAIHNGNAVVKKSFSVVFATAKILIWKQFTTKKVAWNVIARCVCNCKDTNLKAMHNLVGQTFLANGVVFATAKILIWKQFTTSRHSKT